MLRFLRRIRRDLIAKSKLSNYLLYAIGEVALVMIGILLAIQVNNWNEERKNRILELNNLKSLKQEFESNKTKFDKSHQTRLNALEPSRKFNQLLKSGKFTYQEYRESLTIGVDKTYPAYGVINSLISSGEVNLIQPDSLKYALTNWKDFIGDYLNHEEALFEMIVRIWQYSQTHFPRDDWEDYSREQLEAITLQEAAKIDYRNRYNAYFTNINGITQRYKNVEKEMDRILRMIDERIAQL